jgi:hypothetical protein
VQKLSDSRPRRQSLVALPANDALLEAEDPYTTLLPDGAEVVVALVRLERMVYFREPRDCGIFKIVEGPYAGKRIVRFWKLPLRGSIPGRSSSLALDWIAVTQRRPPRRPFGPRTFLDGCLVLARTIVVETNRRNRTVPEAARYSRIDEILSLVAGTPPCMRGGSR